MAAAAFGAVGQIFVWVPVGWVFGLALIVRGIRAGDVELRLRGRCIPCGCQRWGFIMVPCSLQVRCIWEESGKTPCWLNDWCWKTVRAQYYISLMWWLTLWALAKASGRSGQALSLGHIPITFWTISLLPFSRGVRVFSPIWTTPSHMSLSGENTQTKSHHNHNYLTKRPDSSDVKSPNKTRQLIAKLTS